MAKNVIKELIIALLLCLAIILLLGILLYEYAPFTKTIPNPVSYTTPEEVKEELAESDGLDESQIIMTYEVDADDLNNYKRIQDYKPGKANPFSSYETSTNTTSGNSQAASSSSTGGNQGSSTGTQNSSNNGGSSTQSNNDQSSQNTSGGKFFQDKGTK